MTNSVAAIVTISLVTNPVEFLHPSGEEKTVRKIVSEHYETKIQYEGKTILIVTNIPIATNVSRMVWKEIPFKTPRQPLSEKDFPMPKPQ